VFPEGSVDRSYTVKSCKTGAVRLAAQAGVPLIPVAVWGGHRVLTKGHPISMRERLGVAVAINVGPPMRVTEGAAVAQTEALRLTLATLIADAQARYPQIPESRQDWWLPAHLGGGAPTPQEVAVMDFADDVARAEHAAQRR
jgi:1-acyl-sn-glycerol-3-phosphate acyltransferase